jgi:enolase-phosphatase E1
LTTTVVLDIEGTTSATEYVVTTLFPYARARYAEYLSEHDDGRVVQLLADIRDELGEADANVPRIVDALRAWTDADSKVSVLKTLQGWIWEEGFEREELTSHLFPDVAPALRQWHDAGTAIAVYSSGSVDAQRAWFAHSPSGNLLDLITAHFDTENAGPKRDSESYRRIAAALERPPASLVFLSDMRAELDAARAAGWRTVGVRRPGEPAFSAGVGDHDEIATFDQLDLVDR